MVQTNNLKVINQQARVYVAYLLPMIEAVTYVEAKAKKTQLDKLQKQVLNYAAHGWIQGDRFASLFNVFSEHFFSMPFKSC